MGVSVFPSVSPNVPLGRVASATAVANQATITAEVDLTSLTVTFTTVAGRRYRISGSVKVQNTGLNQNILVMQKDGVQVNTAPLVSGIANTDERIDIFFEDTPTAASHTYKLRMSATAGTAQMSAAATSPAQILMEDIGI